MLVIRVVSREFLFYDMLDVKGIVFALLLLRIVFAGCRPCVLIRKVDAI